MKVVRADEESVRSGKAANVVIMNTNDLVYNVVEVSGAHGMYRALNPAIVWDEDILSTTGVYQTKYPVVVANTSDSIISLTEFKWAYAEDPAPIATGLELAVTAETPELAFLATQCAVANALFTDECIALSWSGRSFIVGDKATLSVTTPAEVAEVTFDGEKLTQYVIDENGNKIWSHTFEVTKVGNNAFEVVLYNSDGAASTPILTESITVERKIISSDNIAIEWTDKEFKEGKPATLIVTTPADVDKITVDGIEITEFKLNTDGTKRWEYTFEVKQAGENSYEILLYEGDDLVSDSIKTETVKVAEKSFFERIFEMFVELIRFIRGVFL